MAKYFNFLLVALFGTYFSLEYSKSNAVDASQPVAEVALSDSFTETPPSETPVVLASVSMAKSHIDAEPIKATAPAAEDVAQDMLAVDAAALRKLVKARDLMALPVVSPGKAAIAAPEPTALRVSGSVVNARSGPTTTANVVTRLRRGTEVFGTGETEGDWIRVTVSDTGQEVWMHSDFLADAG